jgi:parallel beta-helix repeat protein
MKRFLVLFFLFFLGFQFASSASTLSACGTISVSGVYELNQSITSTTTCLTVTENDITIDCLGNTISYNSLGGNTQYGINVILATVLLKNITIKNCIIRDVNASGTPVYGIQFTRVSDSYIFNNTIQTNGTASNHGIYMTSACANNVVENNTILAYGTTNTNYGINLVDESSNNTITGNNITVIGNISSYGIYFQTNSNRNIVRDNNIAAVTLALAGGNRDAVGIDLISSSYNVFSQNNLYSLSKQGGYGFAINGDSKSNLIENNSIVSNVTNTTSSYGISVSSSDSTIIRGNNITTYVGTTTSRPIYFSSSQYTVVENNLVISNSSTITTVDGIYAYFSHNSSIRNNTILLGGASTINGLYSFGSTWVEITDNNVSIYGFGAATTFNGIFVSYSTYNSISGNNVSMYGITTLNGIYLYTSAYNSVNNNSVYANGTGATNYGIYFAYSPYNVLSNNSVYASASTPAYGIYLYFSSISNLIYGNYVRTYGTGNANHAICVSSGADQNVVRNNTLFANGAGTTNYGVYLLTVSRNLIESNFIYTNGTTTSHGIRISTQADNNTIQNNLIITNGSSSLYGIYVFAGSNYNRIIGNNITSNGTVQVAGTTTNNEGIVLSTNVYYSEIYNNTIYSGGGRYNYGLYLEVNCRHNVYKWNRVYTGGTGETNAGVLHLASYNNTFEENIISTRGSGTAYGFWFSTNSRNNFVINNNFSTSGGTNSHALYFDASSPNFPQNNTIKNNNFLSIAGIDLFFATASINDTLLVNQPIGAYNFTGVGGTIIIRNESAGEIDYIVPVSGNNVSLSRRVFVNNNFAMIDEFTSALNKSANITLCNIPTASTELRIIRNGVVCPASICTNLTSLQAGNVTFNVTMGGNYSINSSSNLPNISLNLPTLNFVSSQQSINFNFTANDDSVGDLNCSIYLDSVLNQINSSIVNNSLTNFLISDISEGNHSWYVECFDSAGNRNVSGTRNFSIVISQPLSVLNFPNNGLYIDNTSNVTLNYTAIDSDLREMTVWVYGDGVLINTHSGVLNGTSLTYNWQGLSFGMHNWSVKVGNGIKNSSQQYSYFNIINLTINCEVGGPYQQNSLVLVNGDVSDGNSSLSLQEVNVSLYSNGLAISNKSIDSFGGLFQTNFSDLNPGNYLLNATTLYHGINKQCTDSFLVGGSAMLSLDKIVSIQEINSTSTIYNITLRMINYGASDATAVNISDDDYNFSLNSLGAGEVETRSYLLNFTRDSELSFFLSPSASISAIDSYSGNEISASSLAVNLTIPSNETGQQLTLIKNIYYGNQTFNNVNYTVTLQIVNSGGVDLEGIVITDDDLNISDVVNISRTQSVSYSGYNVISKEQNNKEETFSIARAVINLVIYSSNQIKILIPGYGGGPNDVSILAPTSISAGTNFDVTMTVKNINEDIGQDFILSYWLLNNDESISYFFGTQTLFVPGNGSTNSTLVSFLAPTSAGTYKIRVNVSGAGVGVQATAITSFVISLEDLSASSSGGGGGFTGSVIEQVVCPSPYMRYAKECCLDVNNNSICDKDEDVEGVVVASNISNDLYQNRTQISQFNLVDKLNEFGGFFVKLFLEDSLGMFFILLVLFIVLVFILIKFLRKLIIIIDMIKLRISSRKDKNLLSNLYGLRVYSSSGILIGNIKEISLDYKHSRIDGWLIKTSHTARKKFCKRMIFIKHEGIKSIGQILILNKSMDHLFDV